MSDYSDAHKGHAAFHLAWRIWHRMTAQAARDNNWLRHKAPQRDALHDKMMRLMPLILASNGAVENQSAPWGQGDLEAAHAHALRLCDEMRDEAAERREVATMRAASGTFRRSIPVITDDDVATFRELTGVDLDNLDSPDVRRAFDRFANDDDDDQPFDHTFD